MLIPRKENIFSKIRDFFWRYPRGVFGKGGLLYSTYLFYKSVRPFSHIFLFILGFFGLGFANYYHSSAFLKVEEDILTEGVIIGDSVLSRINPLLPSNNQLETDLARLIYHPLIRVNASGEVKPILASSWEETSGDGMEYKLFLRDDVYWHDGEKFTADDVIATFLSGTLCE